MISRSLALAVFLAMGSLALGAGETIRLNVSNLGEQSNSTASRFESSLSQDGRYVAFSSDATNLVPGDTNAASDIFLFDRVQSHIERISVTSNGMQADGPSARPWISADGKFVVFASSASNFTTDAPSGQSNLFLHNNATGETTLVSRSSADEAANLSSFLEARAISDTGRYITFLSAASNLDPLATNGKRQVFVRDTLLGLTKLVSKSKFNIQSSRDCWEPSISGDGRFVAFRTEGANLVPGDTNLAEDVFVHDSQTNLVERVSVASDGTQADDRSYSPEISRNGRYVVFDSYAENLVAGQTATGIFIHDRSTSETTLLSSEAWAPPHVSADGRVVAFHRFLMDRLTGYKKVVTVSSSGVQSPNSYPAHIESVSGDGLFVTFFGLWDGFVTGDSNGLWDLFLHEEAAPNQMMNLTFNRLAVAGHNHFGAMVTLERPAEDLVRITLSASSSNLIPKVWAGAFQPPALLILPGLQSRMFTVESMPVAVSTTESVTAHWGSQTISASIVLVPLVPSAFQFSPSRVTGGASVTARVVLNGVAGVGGETLTLNDDSDFCALPNTVVVPAGASQVTFTIVTTQVSSAHVVAVQARAAGGSRLGHFQIAP